MKYLFQYWDKIKEKLESKKIILFLDYDGTLSPIRKTPQEAVIPLVNKNLLIKLSKDPVFKIVIISGRALKNIKNVIKIPRIIYVGNHGLEIEGPGIKFHNNISPAVKLNLSKIKKQLNKELLAIKGILIEDKGLTLSIHYRLTSPKDIDIVKQTIYKIASGCLAKKIIRINEGKKVIEIKPNVDLDKGKAVLWLLPRLTGFSEKNNFIIYIGDDTTDEDAFKVLKGKGLTIFVGAPKKSYAGYYFKNTRETTKFLQQLSVV
ncbi:MAG: trehalose-phosphatase [Candidatus Omnitrophota bacterium]